jgi:hypothetical protein
MASPRVRVLEDTLVHVSSTVTRKSGKSKYKRIYSLVVNGMLISTSLMGTMLATALMSPA